MSSIWDSGELPSASSERGWGLLYVLRGLGDTLKTGRGFGRVNQIGRAPRGQRSDVGCRRHVVPVDVPWLRCGGVLWLTEVCDFWGRWAEDLPGHWGPRGWTCAYLGFGAP